MLRNCKYENLRRLNMRTVEVKNTAANAGLMGAVGYGVVEALKSGIQAVQTSKLGFFATEPAFFSKILSMESLQFGGVCALFAVVDATARKVINHLNRRETNPPVLDLARVAGSVAVTGMAAQALGLTACACTAGGVVVASMAVYALVHRISEGFNWGAYHIPELKKPVPAAVKA